MANQFLVEIHAYISRQVHDDGRRLAEARSAGDAERTAYLTGRLHQWNEIRLFLSSRFDLSTMKYY